MTAGMVTVALLAAACGSSAKSSSARAGRATSTTTSTTAAPPATTSSTAAGGSSTTTSSPTASSTTSSTTAKTTSTTAAGPRTVTVTEAEANQTVVSRVGDTVKVELGACGGCGYSWRMTGQPNTAVFSYEGQQTETASTTSTSAGSPPMVGLPVTYIWTFRAVAAHTTGFTAAYYPPGRNTPDKTFAVTLRVDR